MPAVIVMGTKCSCRRSFGYANAILLALRNVSVRGAKSQLDHADLLVHRHEVEVVPGLDDLVVFDPHNTDSGKIRFHSSTKSADMGASSGPAASAIRNSHCSFSVCSSFRSTN